MKQKQASFSNPQRKICLPDSHKTKSMRSPSSRSQSNRLNDRSKSRASSPIESSSKSASQRDGELPIADQCRESNKMQTVSQHKQFKQSLKGTGTKTRGSSRMLPEAGHSTCPAKFERQRASSKEVITTAEYALMEESKTMKDMKDDEVHPGLETPITTPRARIKNPHSEVVSPFNSAYPVDFEDDKLVSHSGKLLQSHTRQDSSSSNTQHLAPFRHSQQQHKPGPLGHLGVTSVSSQQCSDHLNSMDNINVQSIYLYGREPNLSVSGAPPSLLVPPSINNNTSSPFERCVSTSSDWANLVATSQDVVHRNSKSMAEDLFQWRPPHASQQSSIPIDRTKQVAISSNDNQPNRLL